MFDRKLFGDRLKYYRNKRGYSQEKLAEKADISNTYLLHLESGDNTPSTNVIVSLLNALNINYSELMDENENDYELTNVLIEKFSSLKINEKNFMSFIINEFIEMR